MKEKVLKIVKNALDGTEDNLYRANMQFGKMNAEQLKKEYGQSGRTCGDVMQDYRDANEELKQCLEWVNGHTA